MIKNKFLSTLYVKSPAWFKRIWLWVFPRVYSLVLQRIANGRYHLLHREKEILRCRNCQAAHREEHREKDRVRYNSDILKNRAISRERARRYFIENRDLINARNRENSREYYLRHKEEINERNREKRRKERELGVLYA